MRWLLTSDHEREFHAVLRLDEDGTWTSLVDADDHDVSARLSPDGMPDGGTAITSTGWTGSPYTASTAPT
jgi:hypothetical protein